METFYSFSGTGQNSLRVIADLVSTLPFLVSITLAALTPLRNLKINLKGKDFYPVLQRYYHNLVK